MYRDYQREYDEFFERHIKVNEKLEKQCNVAERIQNFYGLTMDKDRTVINMQPNTKDFLYQLYEPVAFRYVGLRTYETREYYARHTHRETINVEIELCKRDDLPDYLAVRVYQSHGKKNAGNILTLYEYDWSEDVEDTITVLEHCIKYVRTYMGTISSELQTGITLTSNVKEYAPLGGHWILYTLPHYMIDKELGRTQADVDNQDKRMAELSEKWFGNRRKEKEEDD